MCQTEMKNIGLRLSWAGAVTLFRIERTRIALEGGWAWTEIFC